MVVATFECAVVADPWTFLSVIEAHCKISNQFRICNSVLKYFLRNLHMSVETADWMEQTGAPGSDRGRDLFSCGAISPPFSPVHISNFRLE